MLLPQIRTTDLIEQGADKELLVYDLQINKAYSLNETSSVVFRACDGTTSFEDLRREYKYSDDLIYLTLDELKKNNLIEGEYNSPFAGMNRREVFRKVGIASMIVLPIVAGLVAPLAANAASVCVAPTGRANGSACSQSCQCNSGCCRNATINNQGVTELVNTCGTQRQFPGPICYGGGSFAL